MAGKREMEDGVADMRVLLQVTAGAVTARGNLANLRYETVMTAMLR
jgi:hypothetical protein